MKLFLDDKYKNHINKVIQNIYPSLNSIDLNFLQEKTHDLINYIHLKFIIKTYANQDIIYQTSNKFFEQLCRKNNREIIAICNLLLPFIDDKNSYEKHKLIKSFKDISNLVDKKENEENKKNNNLTNYQYSRGYYDENEKNYVMREFSKEDIEISFKLLLKTIDRISSRMYVNWINIVPITMKTLQKSAIYKATLNNYAFGAENEVKNFNYDISYIGKDEIYDTMVNELYVNVIDIKWLLFERIEIINNNENYIMFLDILDSIYPVYNFIDNQQKNKWVLLSEFEKEIFTNNFNSFFKKIQKKESFDGKLSGNKFSYNTEIIEEFMYYLMTFFDSKYPFKEDILKNGYINIADNIHNDDELHENYRDDDNEGNQKRINDNKEKAFKNFLILDKFFIYDFLRSAILDLNNSWYGFKIFRNNKLLKIHEYKYVTNENKDLEYNEHLYATHNEYTNEQLINLSYKNIYNFSKSLYYFRSNYERYIKNNRNKATFITESNTIYYNDKSIEIRNEIDKYLTPRRGNYTLEERRNIERLLNITRNINLKYKNKTDFEKERLIFSIYTRINVIKIDIVFECLVRRGLLTEYIVRDEKFEKDELKTSKDSQEIFHSHIKKYKDAYYYINDMKYEELGKTVNPKTLKNETYFERLKSMELDWFTFYGMDWISQINFYHHFLNNRVNFLTGGTGVGKSTQVPKLLLYGLKAYDKIFNAKIICTQPRIAPTLDNARRIAMELGVDIEKYNYTYGKMMKTTNGIIQYKYEKDSHIDDDQKFFLRIVTDGSLLSELKESPLLKKPINLSRSNNSVSNEKYYSLKNLYDIIIVDESHEHNPNMDIITTLLRGSIFMNNKLRLFIVSATMDDDDPIYRQYFRFINDNLKYPIRDNYNALTNPPSFDELLDRIVIDRRIHISPPGETTQYIIKEIYNSVNLDEENAYKKAIEYALEICNTSSPINSEILLFCTTENKIIKLVDELNIKLPSNTIAIPFYTKLPEESKQMITSNLNKIKKEWKFERKYVHDVLNLKKKPSEINGTYRYDRILIVSTNIAEASITIDTLKFVIETGFNNDVSYNYDSRTENVTIVPITESSRLQRKGRIGRRSNGTIYYTYQENARKNTNVIYPITKTDFSDTFLSFMEEEFEEKNIFDIEFYPFLKDTFEESDTLCFLRKLNNTEQININILTNKEKILHNYVLLFMKLIKSQFLTTEKISNRLLFRDELNNINLIDQYIYGSIIPFARTGISTNYLVDKQLSFYLIHPFENIIRIYRDKNTRLISQDNQNSEIKIKLAEIFKRNILKNLILNLYIYSESRFILTDHTKVYYKSKMVEYLIKLKQKTDKFIEYNLLYPIVVSNKFNMLDNILFIVYFLIETKNDIFKIIENPEKFNRIFSSKESDLLTINKIYDLFKTTFGHLILEVKVDDKKINLTNQFKIIFSNYLDQKKIAAEYYNLIIKHLLKNNDYETFEENMSNDLNEINISLEKKDEKKKIYNYEKQIKEWCNIYGIKFIEFNRIVDLFKYRYFQY